MVQSKASLLQGKELLIKFLLLYERAAFCNTAVMGVELMTPQGFVSTQAVAEQAAQPSKLSQLFFLTRGILSEGPGVMWLKTRVGTVACLNAKHREERRFFLIGLTLLWQCGTWSHFKVTS